MANYLNEMENEGLIVIGRPVRTEFESSLAIKEAAQFVAKIGSENGVDLSFVYAGTTINWPDDFDYVPMIVGVVTHVDYGSDYDDDAGPLPREALAPRTIPEKVWGALKECGLELDDETGTYLAVAGWTWTQIRVGEDILVGTSADGSGFTRIDDNAAVMESDFPLTMLTCYC